ncbi:MAG: CBS domain-containing protein [Chloroflexota bacterium]
MHIILTHEQADFDALASLLGAHLLNDAALPVLPRRMNRNVRAFLSLYGVDLPFVDPRDLPNQPITQVILVDTQSMVSVRGMSAETRVQVIDHHPLREGLPPDWSIHTVELGATTTLLVEELRDHNGPLSTIQATLLLLGIYEDTGSLTYGRTSPRDLRAAAYLIEQGASLQITNSFLNHPLSQDQQLLYDRLRAQAEHFHIHGYTIVVATGDAQEMDEELSTIAHRLRDLLDPDALFVLVNTRAGVQMIARSTTDNIDVAAVTMRFGGGGHERAAAALIKGRDVDNVRVELTRTLPEYVRPAITVAQIMSRGPQLLHPETPVEEAAQRMRRYGYEGYPVVRKGKVLGLLTRRAVDRAISHKLNLTAGSLMEAGEHYVHPDDSVEHVQRLVTETGWGQIPVVDVHSGEIIGIVTRTDLLKTLAPHPRLPGRQNLGERLESALPHDRLELLKAIAEQAHAQHAALYLVGGFVRDLLLERPSLDFDLVVEGDAIALARALATCYGGRVTSHMRFGTAKWHLDQPVADGLVRRLADSGLQSIDLVSARTEFYTHPTALPTVERGSIKLDLHRRDFTINTLAMRLDGRHYGELHDYWGGLDDLHARLVRVLHSLSFVDDPTRILRAVRFEQRFDFHIEERTMQLLMEARPLIERLSGDRIRHELDHILTTRVPARSLARLHELGMLKIIQPHLAWDDWLQKKIAALPGMRPPEAWKLENAGETAALQRELAYILWLIRLPRQQANAIIARLKLPISLAKSIRAACDLWIDQVTLGAMPPSSLVARLEDVPERAWYALYLGSSQEPVRQALQNYAAQWRFISPSVDGHQLRQRGLPPGPVYRRILGALRSAWLDGQVTTPAEEQALLESLLDQSQSGTTDPV